MCKLRKIVAGTLVAATFAGGMAATPASAQWWGWGWGSGWGGGGSWVGPAIAGAAIGGVLLGAIAASESQYDYGYGYPAYPYRRGRLCVVNSPVYDDWGNFLGYQRVRARC